MKLLAAASFISAAVASAVPRQVSANFQLKTANSTNPAHNGLYVQPFHTGAGMNDLLLEASPDITAYLNGSSLLFNLPGEGPWATSLNAGKYYAGESTFGVIYLLCADASSQAGKMFLSDWLPRS